MRATGLVAIGGASVYAYVTEGGGVTRVRVALDDWDRLGLAEGQQVRVGLPGSADLTLLLTAARRDPPFVWLEMTALGPASRANLDEVWDCVIACVPISSDRIGFEVEKSRFVDDAGSA